MKYKLIVLDLDDTLLKNDRTISKITKEKLYLAQKAGVKIVLASGRPTFGIKSIADKLNLSENGGYIISYNGARIIDCKTQNELFAINITKEDVHYLYDVAVENGAYIQTYIGDDIVANESNEYTDIEQQITGMDVVIRDDFKAAVTTDVVKVIVLQAPEKLKRLEEKLKDEMADKMYMTISKPFFLEFMNKSVDKSKSIERLAKMLSIDMDDVIAIGDSYNDLSMIKSAGLGVAMANSVDEVLKSADYITLDNEHDGVAKVIDEFILN